MSRRVRRPGIFGMALLLGCALPVCLAQQSTPQETAAASIKLTPYEPSGIYRLGETVGWKVVMRPGAHPEGDYTFTAKKNNLDVIKTGHLDLAGGNASIELTLNEPAMVYVEVSRSSAPAAEASSEKPIVVGAAVAPEKLQPVVPKPPDFDSFWRSKIKLLQARPCESRADPGVQRQAGNRLRHHHPGSHRRQTRARAACEAGSGRQVSRPRHFPMGQSAVSAAEGVGHGPGRRGLARAEHRAPRRAAGSARRPTTRRCPRS